ncbi:plastocyanin [Mycobacterium frederiksbergense]|uniref:Plastocyanin n=1 Tax=Mycolicibacterium frederiksbergense TaxID=117567 RepID=A0ABT6L1L3_9MYCO|nr:cupredoxin family copper-binding protein [Mycolicibacterium frederiksbergense]MDH6196839.1 plastocyanin [Mycolicibacterium frederiksbergense]
MFRRSRTTALIAAAVTLAGGLASCSAPPPAAPTQVDFGANGGTPVGLTPMERMRPMPLSAEPAATPQPPVSGTAVTIDNFAFVPATLTVHRGDTVTWTNRDEEPHTVASGDGSFHSPGMGSNATYSYTFGTPGSYDYICSIHPSMHGTVVVTP